MAKNGTLLWIDDEIELLRAHILFLKGKDYEVDTASNGRDATSSALFSASDSKSRNLLS